MKSKKVIYIIGSLKNWKIIKLSNQLRKEFPKWEVFDSWISPGPHADDYWRKYSKKKGQSYKEALNDWSATHIYEFDKFHIDRSDIGILVVPAGKSAHLELGYMIGKGKKCYILFDKEPKKWDIMIQFADKIFFDVETLINELKNIKKNIQNKGKN